MAFEVPRSLSPSKVSSFTDCALAFRFSVIDRLPQAPSVAATKGTLVHAALERLLLAPPGQGTPPPPPPAGGAAQGPAGPAPPGAAVRAAPGGAPPRARPRRAGRGGRRAAR